MRTLGLGAAGRAGKASALEALALDREEGVGGVAREEALGRDGGGAGAVPQAVLVVLDFGAEREVEEERGGKGLDEDDEPGKAPLLPTAEREDWAVDDFKRRTRLPPNPLPFTVPGFMPGRIPLGPGKAG